MNQNIGLEQVVDRHGYTYSLEGFRINTDPYVRKALKMFDYQLYAQLYGYTKQVDVQIGLQNLQLFGAPEHRMSENEWSTEDHHLYNKVIDTVYYKLRSRGPYQLASFEDIFENISNKQASAGFSFPGNKKGEVIEEAFYMSRNILHRMKNGYDVYKPAAKLAFRGHLSELENIKVRPVWNFPFEWLALESMFCYNVYQKLQVSGDILHFGDQAMYKLNRLLNENIELHDLIATTLDWKGFDHHMPKFIIESAFDILKRTLDFQTMTVRGKEIHFSEQKAAQYMLAFENLKDYFINTKIMLPDGTFVQKNRGIPSGSQFTQLIGSICNMIIVNFIFAKQGIRIHKSRYLGDDSLTFCSKQMYNNFNIGKAINDAQNYFNMELHRDKVKITDKNGEIEFLGYKAEGKKFIREENSFFKSALYPEKIVNKRLKSATRMLAYYLLGGNNDHNFACFFRYFRKLYDITSFFFDPENTLKRTWRYVLGRPSQREEITRLNEIGTLFNLSLQDQYAHAY